ncbi:MAG: hypothetical protein WCJ34_04420 [Alcaligenaceae bacterium]
MMYYINHAPAWALLLLFAVVSISLMIVFHKIFRALLDRYAPGYKADLALNIHNSLSTLLALIIAFSLVQAVATYKATEHIVRQEAVRINNLDRLLIRYGNPELETVRVALRTYAQSIVTDEWPEMDAGHMSPKTDALFKPVSKGVIEIKPANPREVAIYNEMLKISDSLADSRNDRLDAAEFAIPGIFWLLIAALLLLKTVLSAYADRSRSSDIVLAVQMAAFSSLLALTFSFDEPLKGEAAIKPEPIIEVIQTITKRTS